MYVNDVKDKTSEYDREKYIAWSEFHFAKVEAWYDSRLYGQFRQDCIEEFERLYEKSKGNVAEM